MRHDATLELARQGDALIVNGEVFDFAPLPEGGLLPQEAIASLWFNGPVQRLGGALHLSLVLPHGADAPEAMRFPQPVLADTDGPIPLSADPAGEDA
jgi:hypothetical protein